VIFLPCRLTEFIMSTYTFGEFSYPILTVGNRQKSCKQVTGKAFYGCINLMQTAHSLLAEALSFAVNVAMVNMATTAGCA
jgi:hypothetical protein